MKREPLTARDIAILASVIVIATCCICGGLALTAIEDVGRILTAHFRWFSQALGVVEPDLYHALVYNFEGEFTVKEGCTFNYVSGSIVTSQGLPGQERAFAGELQPQQVIVHVQDFLNRETFVVSQGKVSLTSGVAVATSVLDQEQVYLSLVKEETAGEITGTASLEGLVQGGVFLAQYTGFYTLSTVVEGQGVQEAVSVIAGLSCPVNWTESRRSISRR
jgi:hypothetical protein